MLVTLTSSTSGEILVFSDIAHRLFEIIGKECTARGVFTKEQLPDAITKLQVAVGAAKDDSSRNKAPAEDSAATPDIGLAQHAHPLIELLERTRQEDGYLMWTAQSPF